MSSAWNVSSLDEFNLQKNDEFVKKLFIGRRVIWNQSENKWTTFSRLSERENISQVSLNSFSSFFFVEISLFVVSPLINFSAGENQFSITKALLSTGRASQEQFSKRLRSPFAETTCELIVWNHLCGFRFLSFTTSRRRERDAKPSHKLFCN